jgi:uncharacterized protein YjbI with pentapeptide repeats
LLCNDCLFGAIHFTGLEGGGSFRSTQFTDETEFWGSFAGAAFSDASLTRGVFRGTTISVAARFDGAKFGAGTFDTVTVDATADFSRSHASWLSMVDSSFMRNSLFASSTWRHGILRGSRFVGRVDFSDATADNLVIEGCTFEQSPSFARTKIRRAFSLAGSTFSGGLDLRHTDLTRAKAIAIDNLAVEPEKFRFRWEQFRSDALGPRLVTRPVLKPTGPLRRYRPVIETPEQEFSRLASSYDLIIRSLSAHGDDKGADAAKFELEGRRQEYFGVLSHRLYGFFLGYGYEPWRIIFVIIVLVGAFSGLYARSSMTIAGILNRDIGEGKISSRAIKRLPRMAYVVLFSASVLLGIRFQREWILPSRPWLTALVITEWLVGIAVYVLFFALVRTSGFVYVKGLLGF